MALRKWSHLVTDLGAETLKARGRESLQAVRSTVVELEAELDAVRMAEHAARERCGRAREEHTHMQQALADLELQLRDEKARNARSRCNAPEAAPLTARRYQDAACCASQTCVDICAAYASATSNVQSCGYEEQQPGSAAMHPQPAHDHKPRFSVRAEQLLAAWEHEAGHTLTRPAVGGGPG